MTAPPLLFEQMQPRSKKKPDGHTLFSEHRLRDALSTAKNGKIVGLKTIATDSNVSISAYILSAHTARLFYLTSVNLPKEQTWRSMTYSCPCIGGRSMVCHHVVTLLLLFVLLQELPTHRPDWFSIPGSLPSLNSKNASVSFKTRWAKEPVYSQSPQDLLFQVMMSPEARHDLGEAYSFQFAPKQVKSRGIPRPPYKTGSWRIAESKREPVSSSQASSQIASSQPVVSSQPTSTSAHTTSSPPSRDRKKEPKCRTCGCPRKGHQRGRCQPELPSSEIPAAASSSEPTVEQQAAAPMVPMADSELTPEPALASIGGERADESEVNTAFTSRVQLAGRISESRRRLLEEQAIRANPDAPRSKRQRRARN